MSLEGTQILKCGGSIYLHIKSSMVIGDNVLTKRGHQGDSSENGVTCITIRCEIAQNPGNFNNFLKKFLNVVCIFPNFAGKFGPSSKIRGSLGPFLVFYVLNCKRGGNGNKLNQAPITGI